MSIPADEGDKLPLFVLSGASGAGKSTIVPLLIDRLDGACVVVDVDWLIDPIRGAAPDGEINWSAFRGTWLHVAAGLARNRLPTVLAGPLIPEHLRDLPGRDLVGEIAYAALDCSDDVRRARIDARPPRRLRDVEEQVAFGAWLRTNVSPVFDTDQATPEATADAVASWIRELLVASEQRRGRRV